MLTFTSKKKNTFKTSNKFAITFTTKLITHLDTTTQFHPASCTRGKEVLQNTPCNWSIYLEYCYFTLDSNTGMFFTDTHGWLMWVHVQVAGYIQTGRARSLLTHYRRLWFVFAVTVAQGAFGQLVSR